MIWVTHKSIDESTFIHIHEPPGCTSNIPGTGKCGQHRGAVQLTDLIVPHGLQVAQPTQRLEYTCRAVYITQCRHETHTQRAQCEVDQGRTRLSVYIETMARLNARHDRTCSLTCLRTVSLGSTTRGKRDFISSLSTLTWPSACCWRLRRSSASAELSPTAASYLPSSPVEPH